MQTGPGDRPIKVRKKKPAPRKVSEVRDTKGNADRAPRRIAENAAQARRASEVKDTKSNADRARSQPQVRKELKRLKTARAEVKDTKGNAERAPQRIAATVEQAAKGKTLTAKVGSGVERAAKDVVHTVYPSGKGKGGKGSAATSSVPMVATGGPARRAQNIGRALVDDTVHGRADTIKNTVKSVPQNAAGAVGAIGSIANDTAHGRATTLKKLPGLAAADYKRRYGASDAEQVKQIQKEGVAADISDATILIGGAGAAVGRALTPIAKTGALGSRAAKVATEARPKLRVHEGDGGAKPQAKSKNLFVAAGQQARDKSRAKKTAKQAARRDSEGNKVPARGMVPHGPDEVVRRSRTRQRFDQRKGVAGQVSRGHIRLKNKQDREVRQGIEAERRVLRKSTPKKDRGVVGDAEQLALEGHINFADAAKTRELLAARRAAIVKNRGTGADAKKVPLIRKGTNDDLARIDRVLKALDDNPSSVLSPALKDFHAKQVARHQRLRADDHIVDNLTSDVRRYMPLARTTGDAQALEAKIARIDEKHANGDFGKGDAAAVKAGELVDHARQQFVTHMKTVTAKHGVGEPVYVLHRPRPTAGYGDYAAGGSKAVAGVKKTSYKLHDTGTQDVTPGAYTQGVAKTIKRNVNWNTVADVLERNAAPWSRGSAGGGRKIETLRKELDQRGLDERDWSVVDLGVYRKRLEAATQGRGDDLANAGEAGLHDALTKATYDLSGAESEFARTNRRFVVVPKAVAGELQDMAKPAGTIRRGIQKFQGVQSRVLLNLNPTFVPVQVIANTPLAVFAMRGNVLDMVKAQRWHKNLDPASQDAVNEFLGISAGQSAIQSPRMGAASPDNKLIRFYRAVVDSDKAQAAKASWVNPMNWNPIFDQAQNDFFRKAVFYNAAKRQAARDMGKAADSIKADAKPLMDILKMPAGDAKLAALKKAEPQFEQVAAHTDEWLGNYLRYTARERQYLKTALLFYGFLRWSIKFTFYTMPVKHPIATAMLAKLGQLHNDEVVDLLSMRAVDESGGRISKQQAADKLRSGGFTDAFGRVYITSDGKLKSIDLSRVNPFTSALTDAMGGGVRSLPGLLSPAAQAVADLAYGRSAFGDKPLHLGGKDVTKASEITAGQGLRYLGRTVARTAAPIRMADNVLNPGAQGDDSLPILGDRPKTPTTDVQKKTAKQRLEDKGSVLNRIGNEVIPLRAKPDNTPRGVSGAVLHDNLTSIANGKKKLEAAGKKFEPGTNIYTAAYAALLDADKRLRTVPGQKAKKVVRGRRANDDPFSRKLAHAMDSSSEDFSNKLDAAMSKLGG